MFYLIAVFILGFILGRAYGWMKYAFPESQEMLRVKVAKLQAERAYHDARREKYRSEIDDSIDERIRERYL